MPHKVIIDPDPSQIQVKARSKQFINRIADVLQRGSTVFVSDVDRRNVWRMKKRLSTKVGGMVDAEAGTYQGLDGYWFMRVTDNAN